MQLVEQLGARLWESQLQRRLQHATLHSEHAKLLVPPFFLRQPFEEEVGQLRLSMRSIF
jgi:hypothetical protein